MRYWVCLVIGGWVIGAGASGEPVARRAVDAGTVYLGAVSGQDWGRPVAAGDLDGDGYDDVLVTASKSYGGVTSRVFIVRGGPDAQRRDWVDLSVGGVDQEIVAAQVDDNLGSSIATGDVDGDGIDDLLVCASTADHGSREDAGIAYLIYGGSDFFESPTRDLSDTSNWDVRFVGPVASGDMGGAGSFNGFDARAAAVGNLNGDELLDIVLGVHSAPGDTGRSQAGRVYVVFGQEFFPGVTFDLNQGYTYNVLIYGKSELDETGDAVLTADLTGDGIDELIIPNGYYSQAVFGVEGAVHVFRGRESWFRTHTLRTGPADITVLGALEYDEVGASAAAGDFNGDTVTDLAIGAPGVDVGEYDLDQGDGFVYGLYGSAEYQTGTHTIDYATDTPDFVMTGEYRENLGVLVSAGDFNGDGLADIAASERFGGPATNGIVEILFGREFVAGETFAAGIDTDARIIGEPNDRIGFALSASDVNGDDLDEVLIATPFNNGTYPNEAGTAYVFTLIDGDVDGSGTVDLFDMAAFQVCFGCELTPGATNPCYVFDFDLDGVITLADWSALARVRTVE